MVQKLKWIVFFAVLEGALSLFIYAAVQQNFRSSANDPQIQMAEDAASALSQGSSVQSVIPSSKVDIATSLAPYTIIYDDIGKPVASQVTLNGQTPVPPQGVFEYVKKYGEDRFSWEPANGVRSAAVVTRYQGKNSGFVLSGRSLREVEVREDNLVRQTKVGWILLVLLSTGIILLLGL